MQLNEYACRLVFIYALFALITTIVVPIVFNVRWWIVLLVVCSPVVLAALSAQVPINIRLRGDDEQSE